MSYVFGRRKVYATQGSLLDAAIAEAYEQDPKGEGGGLPKKGSGSDTQYAAEIVTAVSPLAEALANIAAGVPQKNERTAEALARAAEAKAAAARMEAMGGSAGDSGPMGLPWIAWIAVAGLGAYLLTRKG